MNTLQERIQTLSDADAQHVLNIFASNQPGYSDTLITKELIEALRNEPDLNSNEQINNGDLARSALLLLAEDPKHGDILNALVNGPPARQYEMTMAGTAAIIGGVLFVLGTHIEIKRDKKGQWSFTLIKKPTNPALLKNLMNKLLGFVDKPE